MENKQTAVEWFFEQIDKTYWDYMTVEQQLEIVEQAKQMEKQQKMECWETAHQAGRFEGKGIAEENWQTFEQYYNETFKK